MTYLVFDTETSGLPANNCRDYRNLDAFNSCRLVSVAFVLYDNNHEEISHWHNMIKPEGFEIPEEATKIHGISTTRALAEGKPFSEVYQLIYRLFSEGPTVIAYNIAFDLAVLKSEVRRRDLNMFPDRFTPVCAQKMTTQYNGGRSMRLGAIYKKITGHELEGWHGALADSRAAALVYKTVLTHVPNTPRPLPIRRVVLSASKIAACIGKNPYNKRGDILDELWKKYSPGTFTGSTKSDRALEILAQSKEASAALEVATAARAESSTDTQVIVAEAAARIQADQTMTTTQKRDVLDHIRSSVFTSFGTAKEDRTAVESGLALERDDNFYEYEVTTIFGTKYVIVGRIDRIELQEDGSRVLVEIKNRTRGLFNEVRGYEMIQIQAYLEMLQLEQAKLIEQYNGDQSQQCIQRDRTAWNEVIVPKLVEFCSELHSKMS